MNMKIIVMTILGILVVMSFVQGIQINKLEESFKDINLSATQKGTSSPTSAYSTPTSNVPAMVGGC